jgi:hypothetical protein
MKRKLDVAPWQPALLSATHDDALPDVRMTAGEVVHVWEVAWDTAMMVVPRALMDDPPTAPLLGPPAVELHLKANDWFDSEPRRSPRLVDVIDLSVFGDHHGDPSPEGAATIIAPIGLGREDRRHWAVKTLTRLARVWGFPDADETDVESTVW